MKEKKGLVLAVLALVVLLVGASVLYRNLSAGQEPDNLASQSGQETSSSQQAATAPDFTVLDVNGNEVSLEEMRGKPVILNFWASWCAPCKSEMPAFEEAYREYGDQIHFMMVNLTDGGRETVDTALGYIREQGYTFPVYCDTTLEAGIAYGASAIPITFFIDGEGHGVAYAQSALSRETLQTGIDMLLEK
jgi:thiol-disulfide isomerase/thioredoxin